MHEIVRSSGGSVTTIVPKKGWAWIILGNVCTHHHVIQKYQGFRSTARLQELLILCILLFPFTIKRMSNLRELSDLCGPPECQTSWGRAARTSETIAKETVTIFFYFNKMVNSCMEHDRRLLGGHFLVLHATTQTAGFSKGWSFNKWLSGLTLKCLHFLCLHDIWVRSSLGVERRGPPSDSVGRSTILCPLLGTWSKNTYIHLKLSEQLLALLRLNYSIMKAL